MKKRPLSKIEIIVIVFLLVVAVGVAWYFFFYKNVQNDIAEIENQSLEIDQKISLATAKLAKMNAMQAELDEIFANSEEPSEIAVFDNSQNVMVELNGILSTSMEYSVNFSNPESAESDGIVRRTISLTYKVASYEDAKNILLALEQNHWRCIINSISLSASGSESGIISDNEMTVNASLVFFESTNIKAEETTSEN